MARQPEVFCPGADPASSPRSTRSSAVRPRPTAAGRAPVHHLEPDQARRAPRPGPSGRRQCRDRPGRSCATPESAGRPPQPGRPPKILGSPRRQPASSTSTTAPPPGSSSWPSVVCVDEFGPLNLQLHPGETGSPAAPRPGYATPTTATAGSDTCSPGSISPPANVLPAMRPQALAGVPGLPAPAPPPLPHRAAQRRLRQPLPALQGRSCALVHRHAAGARSSSDCSTCRPPFGYMYPLVERSSVDLPGGTGWGPRSPALLGRSM